MTKDEKGANEALLLCKCVHVYVCVCVRGRVEREVAVAQHWMMPLRNYGSISIPRGNIQFMTYSVTVHPMF